ncbi:MAG TPA: FG-GAP-like repeat-containing protein [bacterium]|nr:FG-GAP-like repeat-containing protein [bacterium]
MKYKPSLLIAAMLTAFAAFALSAPILQAASTPLSTEPLLLTPDALAAQDLKITDLDGDGSLDIAVACYNSPNVVYLNKFGDFSGYSEWESAEADYTLSLALADVTGDGLPDLFSGNSIGQSNRLNVNSVGGLSQAAGWSSFDARWTNAVLAYDFDHDGNIDIFAGGSGENVIYKNLGAGLDAAPFWVSPSRIETRAAAIGEINGDGVPFLAVGNVGVNRIYRIAAGLPEDDPVWTSPDWQATYSLDLGDYDADGDLDLLVGNLDGADQVFANNEGDFGDGPVWTSSDAGATRSIRWCDFADDGFPDVAVATFRSQANAIYSNSNGVIETSASWVSDDAEDTTSMLCTDLDGNGSTDMVVANQDGYVVAYLSLLHSAPFVVETTPEDGDTDVARVAQITVLLYDYDEDMDIGAVELLVNGDSVSFAVTTSSEGATVQFAPAVGYPPDSEVHVTVRAADVEGNQMPDYGFSFTTAGNTAPTLKNGSVNPPIGDTDDVFSFYVDYVDEDYDRPDRADAVIVDESETRVATLPMQVLSTYSYNGTYQAATSLGQGSYYYYFDFEDAFGASCRLPETGYYSGPEVQRHNTAPMLASPMLSPPTGDAETTFWFSVYYWDLDEDAASTAKVVVKSSTSEYSWDMVLQDGTADDGTFSYCASLPAGTYSYYFDFVDERGASVKLPPVGYFIGPVVTGESSPSILSYGGVSPSLGSTSTDFEFRVYYFSAAGDEPSVSTLYYKTELTHSAEMTLGNGMLFDGDYTFKTRLTAQTQWYYFRFVTKGGDSVRLPQEGYFYGPNLAGQGNETLLDTGGVDPVISSGNGTFTFSAHYYDAAGGAPSEAEVHIQASGWSSSETMELVTGESPSNGEYTLETSLSTNTYEYYFVFVDSKGAQVRLPETGSFSGPFVGQSNNPPSLSDASFWPQCGTVQDTFTFSVHYFDEDGNEPGIARVILHAGGEVVPAQLELTSGTAANGTYSVETSVPAGEVRYRFRFVDTKGGAAASPEAELAEGPTVGDFTLSLAVDSDVLWPQDTLNLTLSINNMASTDLAAMFAAAIVLPTGELIYFPDWGMSLAGLDLDFPAGFELSNYPILTMQVPDSAPTGDYIAYAGIFGTGDFGCVLSDLAQSTWRIQPGK